jgi:hypothetical protein
LRNPKPNEIHVWNPFFFNGNSVVPDATTEMDIKEHQEDKHDYFQKSFQFLRLVEVHNDSVDTCYTDYFE